MTYLTQYLFLTLVVVLAVSLGMDLLGDSVLSVAKGIFK